MHQNDWECPRCGANVFASKDACFKCRAVKSSGAGRGGKFSLAGGESSERPSAEVARSSRMDVEPSSSATTSRIVWSSVGGRGWKSRIVDECFDAWWCEPGKAP